MAAKAKTGEGAKSPPKPPRLNVILSKEDKARIDRLVEMMEAETVTDVTKDAFRLLEFLLKKAEGGSKFLIQDPGEEPAKLEIFGVTTK
ncbi:MAG: hypothetical protein AAFR02_07150 [Pseudomonadota bacterium]